ncbi:MAG TPA: response regulator transcription factor [Myxococcaceae bacterium]|jgi:DNA-binding NarL/FixJ family response regulator|nr:response regulator transcription factor [Myxococcaceae bacterium]
MAPIRVFLVDDHPVVREGLRMLLATSDDLKVVGGASSVQEALAALALSPADVVVLDLDLGGRDGLELLPALAAKAPETRVLVLTGIRDRERHRAVLSSGAHGVVLKDKPPELLLKAIRRVHAGELWFDRATMEVAVQRAVSLERARAPEREKITALTAREKQIISLIGEGLRNGEIAARLGIGEKTVRNHLTIIFDKLGVSDRLELAVYAYRQGLAQVPV